MSNWNTAATMTWFILFFICVGYEVYAGINHGEHTPMLTQVVVRYIPWPFTMGFILWLLIHFAVRYADPKYIEWLKSGGAGG